MTSPPAGLKAPDHFSFTSFDKHKAFSANFLNWLEGALAHIKSFHSSFPNKKSEGVVQNNEASSMCWEEEQ